MHADDLLLISITLQDLHKMLDIVCAKLLWLDMVLNVKKSGLMRIGQWFNVNFSLVLVCGVLLPVVEKISYLGKADDLYRGSKQFANHRRTAL